MEYRTVPLLYLHPASCFTGGLRRMSPREGAGREKAGRGTIAIAYRTVPYVPYIAWHGMAWHGMVVQYHSIAYQLTDAGMPQRECGTGMPHVGLDIISSQPDETGCTVPRKTKVMTSGI